jgi:hypothetical protein
MGSDIQSVLGVPVACRPVVPNLGFLGPNISEKIVAADIRVAMLFSLWPIAKTATYTVCWYGSNPASISFVTVSS